VQQILISGAGVWWTRDLPRKRLNRRLIDRQSSPARRYDGPQHGVERYDDEE
jgi:hypothetical protein